MWKSLIQGREILKTSRRWSIGSGMNISLTDDIWLAYGNTVTLNNNASACYMGDLIGANHELDFRSNLTSISDNEALKTPISKSYPKDYLFWPHTKDEIYTIKYSFKKGERIWENMEGKMREIENTYPN